MEIDGDLTRDLKNYAIVATSQYDCTIIMLQVMQIHKFVAEKNPMILIHKIACSRKLLVMIQIQTSIVAKNIPNNATSCNSGSTARSIDLHSSLNSHGCAGEGIGVEARNNSSFFLTNDRLICIDRDLSRFTCTRRQGGEVGGAAIPIAMVAPGDGGGR
jgi:hypothetical protein